MTVPATATGRPSLRVDRRRRRLIDDERFMVIACADVGLQVGPARGTDRIDELRGLLESGVDGVVLTQAMIPVFADLLGAPRFPRLIVRLDWCNQWRGAGLMPVEDALGVTVSSPLDAAAEGADAVIHYLLLGSSDARIEADYVSRAAAAVREAHSINLPCILEPLIRGGNVGGSPLDRNLMRLGIRTAIELGADAVKIEFPRDEDVDSVLSSATVPVFIASTPPISDDEAVRRANRARLGGARGVAYSSDFFASPDWSALVRELGHDPAEDINQQRKS